MSAEIAIVAPQAQEAATMTRAIGGRVASSTRYTTKSWKTIQRAF